MPTEITVVLISSLIGGVLVTLLGFIFNRGKYKAEIEKYKAEIESIKTQTQNTLDQATDLQEQRKIELEKLDSEVAMNRATAEKLHIEALQLREDSLKNNETANSLKEEVKQITSYKNYKKAFEELEQRIRVYLETCRKQNLPAVTLDLKLIAVAMTFSWEHFIVTEIPQILRDFPEANMKLDVLFLDHEFLKLKNLSKQEIDWTMKSYTRISEVKEFAEQCQNFHGRLKFRAHVYKNLPHWHGWLFNGEELFLGRADWNYENGHPILRVGQNKYRHFDTSIPEGIERIDLFKSWQKYYFDYASEPVCESL